VGLVKSVACVTLDRKVLRWIEEKVEEGVFAVEAMLLSMLLGSL
jgi:hypothetical protein